MRAIFRCWLTVEISMILPFCHRQTLHTGQPPKMAKMLPYGSLPHDGFRPLLGQKSCYEKCDRTKMGARTLHPIWMNAMGQRNGLIVRGRPYRTGHVFFPSHHHHHRIWWWNDGKTTQQSTTFWSPMENERENGWWGGRAQWIRLVTPKIRPTKIK